MTARDDDAILREVMHPERRQPDIHLERCRDYDELDLVMGDEHMSSRTHMTAADLDALRAVLGVPSARERALANVRYLAALDPRVLRETLLVFRHEHPDKAARLLALLTGAAEPAWRDPGVHDPDRGASYDRQ